MSENSQVIFGFLEDSLKVAGSPYTAINGELLMAQCQVQVPRSFFRPARTEIMNLQMVCRPHLLEKYPGSELVTKGSYRLQWFIDGIRERGLVVKGTYHYELDPRKIQREIKALLKDTPQFFFEQPLLIYQPLLLVNFKVAFETDEKFEELYSLDINLVNGEINHNLFAQLAGKKIGSEKPRKLEKRKISYREGFEALYNHLKWILKNHDHDWVNSAKIRCEEEISHLESYYYNHHESHPAQREPDYHQQKNEVEAGFYRRIAETYRKFQPMIRIQICNAALFYLPIIRYTVEPFNHTAGEPLPSLIFDPLRHKIRWYHNITNPLEESISRKSAETERKTKA